MSHAVYKMEPFTDDMTPFKLLYVTHSKYDKGWHSTSHTHHFTELFYIVKGKGAFVLHDHEFPVKENDLVIMNPNIEHTERSNQEDSLEYIALGIEGILFTLPKEDDSQTHLFIYQGNQTDILFYLNRLLDEVKYKRAAYKVICHNIVEIIIAKLNRTQNITMKENEPKRINQSVAIVMHYINQNFRDAMTLDTLADIGIINKYYLAHQFKEDIGLSPIEYLNSVRFKEAKTLLETTDLTISEIARFNGFSSQSFFSQAFKRETNMTPSAYRKQVI